MTGNKSERSQAHTSNNWPKSRNERSKWRAKRLVTGVSKESPNQQVINMTPQVRNGPSALARDHKGSSELE